MSKDWEPYVVQQGDHLDKLAYRRGVEPDEIWAHEKNADLADQRENRDTLAAGDLIHLPANPTEGQDITPGVANHYKAIIPTIPVSVLVAVDDVPVANEPYEVRGIYPGDRALEGTTSPDGEVELDVPVHVREIEIEIKERGIIIPVSVGDLDPIEERGGLVQRLRNLDFIQEEGEVDDETLAASLRHFQVTEGLPPTGDADDKTRSVILERHGI